MKKIKNPKRVMLLSNGGVACFDKNGEQISELQKGWLIIWLEWLEGKGVRIEEIENIEAVVNGQMSILKPFKTKFGWNCEISPAYLHTKLIKEK